MAQYLQNLALALPVLDPLKVADITGVNREEIDVLIQVSIDAVKQWSKFKEVIPNQLFLMRVFLKQTFLYDVSNIIFCDDDIRKPVLHLVKHFCCELELRRTV